MLYRRSGALLGARILLSGTLLSCAAVSTSHAAAQMPPKPPSTFRQLFPEPSGKNGYEELLLAGDILRASPHYPRLGDPAVTLTMRRRILSDPSIRRALTLLRQGLSKPVISPRAELSFDTQLPELAHFRQLGRLIAMEIGVLLADGKVPEAIATARRGLHFSRVIQQDLLIGGLVGIAVGVSCLNPITEHLDQLSARDCAQLFAVCQEWLAQPSPQAAIIQSEMRSMQHSLAAVRKEFKLMGAEEIESFVQEFLDEEPQGFIQAAPKNPEELDRLFAEVAKRVEQRHRDLLAELQKPPWLRQITEQPQSDDLPSRVASLFIADFSAVDHAYTEEVARMRLLACHCAIRRYRWEHNRLPANLEELQLGELAVDPFTGQPLRYVQKGKRYSLTSVGAPAASDRPDAVDGRIPVTLTPDD